MKILNFMLYFVHCITVLLYIHDIYGPTRESAPTAVHEPEHGAPAMRSRPDMSTEAMMAERSTRPIAVATASVAPVPTAMPEATPIRVHRVEEEERSSDEPARGSTGSRDVRVGDRVASRENEQGRVMDDIQSIKGDMRIDRAEKARRINTILNRMREMPNNEIIRSSLEYIDPGSLGSIINRLTPSNQHALIKWLADNHAREIFAIARPEIIRVLLAYNFLRLLGLPYLPLTEQIGRNPAKIREWLEIFDDLSRYSADHRDLLSAYTWLFTKYKGYRDQLPSDQSQASSSLINRFDAFGALLMRLGQIVRQRWTNFPINGEFNEERTRQFLTEAANMHDQYDPERMRTAPLPLYTPEIGQIVGNILRRSAQSSVPSTSTGSSGILGSISSVLRRLLPAGFSAPNR